MGDELQQFSGVEGHGDDVGSAKPQLDEKVKVASPCQPILGDAPELRPAISGAPAAPDTGRDCRPPQQRRCSAVHTVDPQNCARAQYRQTSGRA